MLTLPRILEVWRSLGGGELRRDRGRAFWRNADGFNVKLDQERNSFYDFAHAEGGGVVRLVELALGVDRAQAWGWLREAFGVDAPAPGRDRARQRERERALETGEARRFLAWLLAQREARHDEAARFSASIWNEAQDEASKQARKNAEQAIYATYREIERLKNPTAELVGEFEAADRASYAEWLECLALTDWAIDALARFDHAQRAA